MNKRVLIAILLVLAWMLFIFIMSGMDSSQSNGKSKNVTVNVITTVDKITKASKETVIKHQEETFIDKINLLIRKSSHAMEYLVLGFLIINLFYQMSKNSPIHYFYSLLISFLYACTDEFHQTFVEGRTGQFIDVIIDSLGAIFGCIIFFFVAKLIMKMKKERGKKEQVIVS